MSTLCKWCQEETEIPDLKECNSCWLIRRKIEHNWRVVKRILLAHLLGEKLAREIEDAPIENQSTFENLKSLEESGEEGG